MLSALRSGYSLLGFSDHTPWPYEDGFVSIARMLPDQLDGYVNSVQELQRKYRGQIEIQLGLEAEYQPQDLRYLLEKKQQYRMDFLILGVHYNNRREEVYYGKVSQPEHIKTCGKLTVEAIENSSRLFDCLAHPDLFMQAYPGFDKLCASVSRDICQAAKACSLPLEYNLSGFYNYTRRMGGVGYPCLDFWQIAAREGCSAIIGIDAHSPDRMEDTPLYDLALQHLKGLGIPVLDRLK